jgi:hypothetical protein
MTTVEASEQIAMVVEWILINPSGASRRQSELVVANRILASSKP